MIKRTFLPLLGWVRRTDEEKTNRKKKKSDVLIGLPLYKKKKMELREILKVVLGNY